MCKLRLNLTKILITKTNFEGILKQLNILIKNHVS